jgi:hypothetical protein
MFVVIRLSLSVVSSVINFARRFGDKCNGSLLSSSITWQRRISNQARRRREWMYRSIFSWPGHWLEASGHLRCPAVLLPRKEPPISSTWGLGNPRTDLDIVDKWKFLSLLGFEPRPLDGAASRYELRFLKAQRTSTASKWEHCAGKHWRQLVLLARAFPCRVQLLSSEALGCYILLFPLL